MKKVISINWLVAILLSFILVLAACSSAEENNTSAGSSGPAVSGAANGQDGQQASGQQGEAEAGAGADKGTLPATEAQAEAAYPLVVKHMKGEVTLEQKPEIIAVLDTKFVDQLVVLGEQPAGSVTAAGSDTDFPEYLLDQLGDVKVLGTRDEPNMEAVLALNPDLIIATDFQEEVYDSLNKIAPTIMLNFYEDWRVTLDTIGKIVDKQAEAQAVEQAYDTKVAGLKEQLAAKLGEQTVALIRPRDEGIRVHTPQHRTGAILYNDLGLNAPVATTKVDDTAYEIPLEVLGDVDADHYFLLSDALFSGAVEEMLATNTWRSLEPVKNNHVYNVDSTMWIAYYGPIAINLIVDQAAAALLGAE